MTRSTCCGCAPTRGRSWARRSSATSRRGSRIPRGAAKMRRLATLELQDEGGHRPRPRASGPFHRARSRDVHAGRRARRRHALGGLPRLRRRRSPSSSSRSTVASASSIRPSRTPRTSSSHTRRRCAPLHAPSSKAGPRPHSPRSMRWPTCAEGSHGRRRRASIASTGATTRQSRSEPGTPRGRRPMRTPSTTPWTLRSSSASTASAGLASGAWPTSAAGRAARPVGSGPAVTSRSTVSTSRPRCSSWPSTRGLHERLVQSDVRATHARCRRLRPRRVQPGRRAPPRARAALRGGPPAARARRRLRPRRRPSLLPDGGRDADPLRHAGRTGRHRDASPPARRARGGGAGRRPGGDRAARGAGG